VPPHGGEGGSTHWVNRKAIPCRFGAACHHITCEYSHPERDAAAAADAADAEFTAAGLPRSRKFGSDAATLAAGLDAEGARMHAEAAGGGGRAASKASLHHHTAVPPA